jgi:hypothetical protein
MRIHALLAWYDEPIDALERAVQSCEGFADHLIAIDGRYRLFAPDKPAASDPEQAEAIRFMAEVCNLKATIITPTGPWASEGEKRTELFRQAELAGTPYEDWVIPIDADEEFTNTNGVREFLSTATGDAYAFHYDTIDVDTIPAGERRDVLLAGTDVRSHAQTRCLRLMIGMRVEPPTHWQFTGVFPDRVRRKLDKPEGILGLRIVHHTVKRPYERWVSKAEYVEARTAAGEV